MRNAFVATIIAFFAFSNTFALAKENNINFKFGVVVQHSAINPSIIIQALKPFSEYISKRLKTKCEIVIFPNVESLSVALTNGTINTGQVSSLEYVKLKEKFDIKPIIKGINDGSSNYKALLLVHKDSNFECLKELRGKKFVYSSKDSAHGYLYPSLLIKTKLNSSIESYFGNITRTQKDVDGILSVYYKQADIVSASSRSYELLCQLKPQLRRQLKILNASEPITSDPIFLYEKNFNDKSKIKILKKELLNMHRVPEGSKILLLFKISQMTDACDNDYNTLREMLAKERSL